MPAVNPIITKTLHHYLKDNPEIPSELGNLIEKLLEIEKISGSSTGGIDKMYEQIFAKFVDNEELIEWSKKYVS